MRTVVFERYAAQAEGEGLAKEVVELCGGGADGEAGWADVGDAVAVGVGSANEGAVGEIGAEAVGRAEAGAFAQED